MRPSAPMIRKTPISQALTIGVDTSHAMSPMDVSDVRHITSLKMSHRRSVTVYVAIEGVVVKR
jgi:hypothetical protein